MYLFHKLTPYLQRAIWIDSGKVSECVIFYCFYRDLCRIDSMIVWLDELDLSVVGLDVGFDGAGAFIVEDMECWLVAVSFEFLVDGLESVDHIGVSAAL